MFSVSSNSITAAISVVVIIITATALIIIIVVAACCSKYNGQGDDQRQCSQDVVDNSGNIAADSDSVEGPGSVPLLSRPRVTQRISLC